MNGRVSSSWSTNNTVILYMFKILWSLNFFFLILCWFKTTFRFESYDSSSRGRFFFFIIPVLILCCKIILWSTDLSPQSFEITTVNVQWTTSACMYIHLNVKRNNSDMKWPKCLKEKTQNSSLLSWCTYQDALYPQLFSTLRDTIDWTIICLLLHLGKKIGRSVGHSLVSGIFKIKAKISNLVHTTRAWNNIHQVGLKSKDCKGK